MSNNTYIAGSLVRVATYIGSLSSPAGGFRDANGVLADPTTVVLKYRPGVSASPITVSSPIRDGVGLYHYDLDTTGFPTDVWTYYWDGTGAVQAIDENSFSVRGLPF